VQGIDAGADDYVAKPFHVEEVLARVRALVRRAAGHASNTLVCGPVQLDLKASRVTVDGNPVKLTSHEYKVLEYLMHHPKKVVSRTELTEHLYDQDFDRDSNTIEVLLAAFAEARHRPDRNRARHGLPDRPNGACAVGRSPSAWR
jgi:two-component system OmpR family response regulator